MKVTYIELTEQAIVLIKYFNMSYKERFIDVIIEHSIAEDWESAKTEWSHISSDDIHDSNCICGQAITEVCTIKNIHNNTKLEVGNVCVNKFLDIDRESDFKLIKKNIIDDGLLDELCYNKAISISDMKFYQDIKLKRNLSHKQSAWKNRILLKSKQWVTKSGKGVIDQDAFKNIKKSMTQEHKDLLGKHLIEVGYKLVKDKSGKTIDDVITDMKNVFVQLKKLKEYYERG